MLWFHGGSGSTGNWSHTAGVARVLRALGVTVIAVEFRTGNRFDPTPTPTPTQSIADAIDAFAWVERHARRLHIDSTRIGVAGFSSGSGLALLLGTRGLGPIDRPPTKGERRFPAVVLVTGACPAPASPREDGYWRKSISRIGKPEDYSPIDLIREKQPPTLVIQGADDEYCAYSDAKAFVERSRAAGNDAELSTVEGASHFFPFYHRPGQEQLRAATEAALVRWGWVRQPGDCAAHLAHVAFCRR